MFSSWSSWLILFLNPIFIQRMSFVPNIKYKTEYCLYWQEGKCCEKGTHCFFAHGPQELRTIQENHQQIMARQSQLGQNPPRPNNYKTIFCKFYAQGKIEKKVGLCKLGEKCTYAHERREKRRKKMSHDIKGQSYLPQTEGWTQSQIQQYYNQLYYYQMYNPQHPFFQAQEQGLPAHHFQPSQNYPPQQSSSLHSAPQDMPISMEVKPDIADSGREEEEWSGQKLQSPSASGESGSPESGKTDSTVLKTSAQIDQLQKSTDFKIEQ